ncbi:UNVERIFIED_CONTAM: hypothetical protein GTU68_006987 [Idotea baltica]|nr:hypothetical protein [Idotea baltica]
MPILTSALPTHFTPMQWGLIPSWAKDKRVGYKMINARSETVCEKSAFKSAIESRRCLVPMDGYYEWKKSGKTKTPYRIIVSDQDVFCMAGIWERWKSPEGELINSFTILTQTPSESIAHIHDRMPAILSRDQESFWIDPALSRTEALSILSPYEDALLKAYEVSDRVGKVSENDADLILERRDVSGQTSLF